MLEKHLNIKLTLFILVVSIVIGIFGLNHLVINQLRNEAKSQAEYLAKSYSNAINSMEEDDIRFIIDILLPSIKFPIIITSNNEISVMINIEITDSIGTNKYNNSAWKLVKKMSSQGYLRRHGSDNLMVVNSNEDVKSYENEHQDVKIESAILSSGSSDQPMSQIQAARMMGYEGDSCPECSSFTLIRNGTCLKCDTCGATTGCS